MASNVLFVVNDEQLAIVTILPGVSLGFKGDLAASDLELEGGQFGRALAVNFGLAMTV